MSQIATVYILKKGDASKDFANKAIETIDYKWSGYAFVILSAYTEEEKGFDWQSLELNDLSLNLSEQSGTWITIFSAKDKQTILTKLNPENFSIDELENFAMDFSGEEDFGRPIMDAIKTLYSALSKTDEGEIVLLEATT